MSFIAPEINFYQAQLRFPRVREALKTKGKIVDEILTAKGISTTNFEVFHRLFCPWFLGLHAHGENAIEPDKN